MSQFGVDPNPSRDPNPHSQVPQQPDQNFPKDLGADLSRLAKTVSMDNKPKAQESAQFNQVFLQRKPDGSAVLTIGVEGEAPIFTRERIFSLAKTVEELKNAPPTSLIITGATTKQFSPGVDIKMMAKFKNAAEAEALVRLGQKVLDDIQALPCTTVAALGGTTLGGACELALSCDYRVMADRPGVHIGLPEVKLGLLPGWGGCQRLPRLIGLKKALGIILEGGRLDPKSAAKVGFVDEAVPAEKLQERAEAFAKQGKPNRQFKTFSERVAVSEGLLGRVARWWSDARGQTLKLVNEKDPHGHYPALREAVNSVYEGLDRGMPAGLDYEARSVSQLVVGPVSKGLRHLFFLDERAKGMGKGTSFATNPDSLVVGAGVMGGGIAALLASRSGGRVALQDLDGAKLEEARARIERYVDKAPTLSDPDKEQRKNGLVLSKGEAISWVSQAPIAIEAVSENMALKLKLLAGMEERISPNAVLGTNTSSLPISELAKALKHPDRLVGLHFFNPPEKMPLLEIIKGNETSVETLAKATAIATMLGKIPIVVKDVPGFLVNNLLSPYVTEALHLLKDGYSVEQIDAAAEKFGMVMGPFKMLDRVGLDTACSVQEVMAKAYGDRYQGADLNFVRESLKKLTDAGRLGMKSGGGFYEYSADREIAQSFSGLADAIGVVQAKSSNDEQHIQQRLALILVKYSLEAFDGGVAGTPSKDAAAQIDLASVYGFSFPGFRGGVMHYAKEVGAKELLQQFKTLQSELGAEDRKRFEPSAGLASRAASGAEIY